MATPWALLNESSQNNSKDFSVFRCINPTATITEYPWYSSGTNVCPCDPNLSNPSGRGFISCPYGINNTSSSFKQSDDSFPYNNQITGNLYPKEQFVPPQIQPNPLVKIGYSWRSNN